MNTKTMRMTEGNILKGLIGFAIPILIGNIFQQLYNVADTAIIGNLLGDDALAAVGAATPVYNLLVGLALGITNGFAVVIARHFGARRHETMRRAVSLTYILSGIVAVTLTVLGILGLHPLMAFLKTPDKIIADTESYMMVITVGFTLTIAYNMLAGMLRAIGNSRASLYFLVISTFLNIGLDFLFVGGMGMGVAGAAWATAFARAVQFALLAAVHTIRHIPSFPISFFRPFPWRELKNLLTVGAPTVGEELSYCLSQVAVIYFINRISTEALATKTYCSNLIIGV